MWLSQVRHIYLAEKSLSKAVMWLRWLVTSLSPRKAGLVHVGFMVDKVALVQVFLHVLWFSSFGIILLGLHTHTSSSGWAVGLFVATVQRHGLILSTWTTTARLVRILWVWRRLLCKRTESFPVFYFMKLGSYNTESHYTVFVLKVYEVLLSCLKCH
jgi:hypothetical protein